MGKQTDLVKKILEADSRYDWEAYRFVREALAYAHDVLKMDGTESVPEGESGEGRVERHLTGQMLCEAIRVYAIEQYGYMARVVLENWGVKKTSDFGDIVYNLINAGLMKKSKEDRREDFNDVYDFETVFDKSFKIAPPDATAG
ncbi:MAG: Minf_1886 family protein [Planctomycetota bacterium]